MRMPLTRRQFVNRTLQAGALAGLADLSFLSDLPAVAADEAKLAPGVVRFTPEIEPLVRLLEDTSRDKVLDAVASRLRTGTNYQQLLTAVFLAGVRGIKPRPVGFKFHAVLVINSAHLASLAAEDRDRWLPLLWAIDNYKVSQAKNKEESAGWMMSAVEEGKLPTAAQAKKRFVEAMDNWDEDGADRAVTALARSAGASAIVELLWRYGARDFRDIGHKAIYVANSWRLLQVIGWRHAEPVLRSLAFALLEHEGTNPAKRDGDPDRPWRDNLRRVGQIRPEWQRGKVSASAATDLLATLRTANSNDACDKVLELLNKEIDPASIWDGLFLRAGELLVCQPGIGGLHCVTATNALHYGYLASGNDETRRMLMLQGAAFLPMFRDFMSSRGKVRDDLRLDVLERADLKNSGPQALEEIFAEVSKDKLTASRKALAWLEQKDARPDDLQAAARRLIFSKGTDAHDYKFSVAALEDYYHVTPALRNRYLAASMCWLRGSGDKNNDLIRRARAAV